MIFGTLYDLADGTVIFFPDHRCMLCKGSGRCGKRVQDEKTGELIRYDDSEKVTCEICLGYGWIEQVPYPPPHNQVGYPRRAYKLVEGDRVFWDIRDEQVDPLGAHARTVLKRSPTKLWTSYG